MADLKENEITTTENVEEVKETDKGLEQVPTEKDATITEEKEENSPENTENDDTPPKEEGVIDETPTGNGARIEDLITKDEFEARFAALESKYDAVLKENNDLKEALAKMTEKYEDPNFGDYQRRGVQSKDDIANDTFDSYSRQFM